MADSARQTAEARVIKGARAYAVRRVESTVRHLRKVAQEFPAEYRRPNGADDLARAEVDKARRLTTPTMAPTEIMSAGISSEPSQQHTDQTRAEPTRVDQDDKEREPLESVEQTVSEPEDVEPDGVLATYPFDPDVTEALQEPPTVRHADTPVGDAATEEASTSTHAAPPVDEITTEIATVGHTEPPVGQGPTPVPPTGYGEIPVYEAPTQELPAATRAEPPVEEAAAEEPPATRQVEPVGEEAAAEEPPRTRQVEPVGEEAAAEPESDLERLQRLLGCVARQEPGLRWAVGDREDGTTVLVTDLAHGWVPPRIALPAGVRLLEPRWRTGNAAALLGPTTLSATYTPGDPLGWAAESDITESSVQPREIPEVDDLGWLLSEATHWRDGLPRIVHTLAKAGAAGTGVVDLELEVLRVHLEITRYHLVAQYPDVDAALLLNCLLLAATEGIATSDRISANYHFAWFQMLSAPPTSKWTANP
jgi:hypothetical protein